MQNVADLRRALGLAAPRDSDSLYRPIERGARKFNPLKIPKSLQVGRACCLWCRGGAEACSGVCVWEVGGR